MEVYGRGYIISGRKGLKEVDYFILEEDPRTDSWIHMIASQLEEESV